MKKPKWFKQILLSGAILLTLTLQIWVIQNVFATELWELSISKNYQVFLDYNKNPNLKSIIDSDDFSYKVIPNTYIDIIQRDNSLQFWLQHWEIDSQADLEIVYKWKTYVVPLNVERKLDMTDFNLRDDFYELSLQKKDLSCESSATSDILETMLGTYIHEDDVISKLPVGNTYNKLPTNQTGEKIWWDPNAGFVWKIDNASQKTMTWYGVYEKPIADVYEQYGFETETMSRDTLDDAITPEIHLEYILTKLSRWNMVQLWGDWCTRPEFDDGVLTTANWVDVNNLWDFISAKNGCYNVNSDRTLKWSYEDENWNLIKHEWLDGEHAFVLLGWKWDISNPTHVRVWDTDTWYHMYETQEWMRKWKAMDYRTVVISKKDS